MHLTAEDTGRRDGEQRVLAHVLNTWMHTERVGLAASREEVWS
jgi:hypothetical protein